MTGNETSRDLALIKKEGTTIIRLTRADLLDPGFLTQIQLQSLAAILEGPGQSVVLDWTRVRFISSAVVGMLMGLHRAVSDSGGRIALACPSEDVRSILTTCRVNEVIPIHPKLESALQSVRKQD